MFWPGWLSNPRNTSRGRWGWRIIIPAWSSFKMGATHCWTICRPIQYPLLPAPKYRPKPTHTIEVPVHAERAWCELSLPITTLLHAASVLLPIRYSSIHEAMIGLRASHEHRPSAARAPAILPVRTQVDIHAPLWMRGMDGYHMKTRKQDS